jgi:cell division protein FtsW
LVSMGGSSFLFTCASIGIVLSVARNVEQLEGKEPVMVAEVGTGPTSPAEAGGQVRQKKVEKEVGEAVE